MSSDPTTGVASERSSTVAELEVPEIITDAGEPVIEQYRAFFDRPSLSPNTRQYYGSVIRRFLLWAEQHRLSLHSIAASDATAFCREICPPDTASASAGNYLSAIRGLFRHFEATGVLKENPFRGVKTTMGLGRDHRDGRAGSFPLLSVMAMLTNMEEQSRERVFAEERIARKLLQFVRWPEERKCTHCGSLDEAATEDTGNEAREFQCQACCRTYAVTDGSPFEGMPDSLGQGLRLLFWHFLSDEHQPGTTGHLPAQSIDDAVASQLAARIQEALARQGLARRDALDRAITRRDREMVQEQIVRGIKRYVELESARDQLLKAKADGSFFADLPPDMTLDEAIDTINAQIAEIDRYPIMLKNGYLAYHFPETAESEAMQPEAGTRASEQEADDER